MKFAFIDHYDSFSFNVIAWLRDGGAEVDVLAFDDRTALTALVDRPLPLVLSPGPKRPADASSTLSLVQNLLGTVPILGVCLGHQILGAASGAGIVRSKAPFHGSARNIRPTDVGRLSPLFKGLEQGFRAAVYHSLVVCPDQLDRRWQVTALDDLGEVQAIERLVLGEAPAFGVQFHPESFLSEHAEILRDNWLRCVASWRSASANLDLG